MAMAMNLFGSTKTRANDQLDKDIKVFLLTLSQVRSANGVNGMHLWSGERGYWIAYMLQLAFGGTIVEDTFDGRYYWQAENGWLYDGIGQINGVITKAVNEVPDFYRGLSPEEFTQRFLFDSVTAAEVMGLQSLFRKEYAWYYAHFLEKSWGRGGVYILVDNSGGLHPACVNEKEEHFFVVMGKGRLEPGQYISEDEFGQSIDYFKCLPSVSEGARQEVLAIVKNKLG